MPEEKIDSQNNNKEETNAGDKPVEQGSDSEKPQSEPVESVKVSQEPTEEPIKESVLVTSEPEKVRESTPAVTKAPEQEPEAEKLEIPEEPIIAEPSAQKEPAVPLEQSQPQKSEQAVTSNKNIIKKLLQKAQAKIQTRRQKRLDKILVALQEKSRLSNKDIRKIIRKSRYTIVRYLDILEKQGKVRQVGKIGKHTYYELIR